MEPVYRTRMRGIELKAVFFELPQMLGGLVLGGLCGALFAWIINSYSNVLSIPQQYAIFAGFLAVGFFFFFWAASYYPQELSVFEDRLHFRMAFSTRTVPLAEVLALRELTEAEAKKTFFSLHYANLSPGVAGAVELQRRRGRVWVFCPDDPAELARVVAARLPAAGATPAQAVRPEEEHHG